MLGWENLFHCEINPFGRRVLDYWYPNSKSYEDITTTDFTEWRGRVNVLTGGFPCQPFSYAGKRGGAQDDRYLWPYMFRCIDQIRPDWVVAENVAGILTMVEQGEVSEVASAPALFDTFDRVRRYQLRETFTLQRICDDLESHGYAVQPVLVPACGVGAPHRRDRVFIIGHRTKDVDDADTNGKHEGGLRASGTAKGERSHDDIQQGEQSERTRAASRTTDVHGILRPSADGAIDGLQHDTVTRSKAESNRATPRRETELHLSTATNGGGRTFADTSEQSSERLRPEQSEVGRAQQVESGRRGRQNGNAQSFADYHRTRLERWYNGNPTRPAATEDRPTGFVYQDNGTAGVGRWGTFPSVSPVHRGNDGLPFDVDRLTLSFGKWRTEALKAYGNAIVPQVMYEIFRAIQQVEQDL